MIGRISTFRQIGATVLALVMHVASFGQEKINISPISAEYAPFIQWSNLSGPTSQLEWLKNRFAQTLTTAEKTVLDNVDIVWEGTDASRECADVRQLAYTFSPRDGRAVIRICLRTLMYVGDFDRAIYYIVTPSSLSKEGETTYINSDYFKYLKASLKRDNNFGLPYKSFCTAEFLAYAIKIQKFEVKDCESAAKNFALVEEFQKWCAKGEIWTPEFRTVLGIPALGETIEKSMSDFYLEYFKNAQISIIYSALAHEMGHIFSCQFGSIGSLRCKTSHAPLKKTSITDFNENEFSADAWAMQQLAKELTKSTEAGTDEWKLTLLSMNWLMLNRFFAGIAIDDNAESNKKKLEELQARLKIHEKRHADLALRIADQVSKTNPAAANLMRNSVQVSMPTSAAR